MGSKTSLPAEISGYPLSAQTRTFLAQHGASATSSTAKCAPRRNGETLPVHEPATGLEFARIAAGSRVRRRPRGAQRARRVR